MLRDVKQLLHTAAYHPVEIERVLTMDSFLRFDPEVGYTQIDYVFRDGMEDTLSVYTYDQDRVHRKLVNYADQPCRINTYGDSFTQCAQVSDGETWQEILAAHFREPVKNFGFGGYGVYQAYRLALRMEATEQAADYVLLNMWGPDDHLRNLDAARWIRVGWMHRELPRGGGEGTYPVHGFPWAHVRYDLDKGQFVEHPGMCKTGDDLRKLVGPDAFYEAFKDDPVVHLFALTEGGEAPVDEAEKLAEEFGVPVNLRDPNTRQADAQKLHIAYGVRSSMFIVDKMQAWANENGRKLMVLLSFDTPPVKEYLETGRRFDTALLEHLDSNQITYVDCLQKAADDYKAFNLSVDEFLERTYIGRAGAQVFGHYNPYGNFWFAYAIREALVNWLDPKPTSYQ